MRTETQALLLKASPALAQVPPDRPAAPAALPVPVQQATQPTVQMFAPLPQAAPLLAVAPASTWLLAATTLLACVAWLMEHRRRRSLEVDRDSMLWADEVTQRRGGPAARLGVRGLSAVLPDGPDPDQAAHAIVYATAIAETNSRREATLIDLHELRGKLERRRERGDDASATQLLQRHLVDFRYTSPWVFLELRELYQAHGRRQEWTVAREAFKERFGQNAPAWEAPGTDEQELAGDAQLAGAITAAWPSRKARLVVVRWMLGENEMRKRACGPPLLGLGLYRDMLLLDSLLDEVMEKPADKATDKATGRTAETAAAT